METERAAGINFLPLVLLPQERPFPQFAESLSQLLLRVHHDGPVPGHRLLKRLAGNQQEANTFLAGLNGDFVAAVKKDQRSIVCLGWRIGFKPSDSFGGNGQRTEALQNFPDPEKT